MAGKEKDQPVVYKDLRQKVLEARRNADTTRLAVLVPIVQEILGQGAISYRAVAEALNERGVTAARGGKWSAAQVRIMLARLPAADL
jgi:Recombinase